MALHLLLSQAERRISMNPAFDESYLHALQHQDLAIEDHLVRCFSKALKVPLRRHFYGKQAIEDITQETLFRVLTYFRSGKTLHTPSKLPAFVNSVLCNVTRELRRKERRSRPLDDSYDCPVDEEDSPEATAIANESARNVRRILLRLPKKDQEILGLVFLEDLDKDEVCRNLQTNREHLRVLVFRARHRFRALVESERDPSHSLPEKVDAYKPAVSCDLA
jgi:RNA polymerase sigma-70 factor, ECF subfamily